MFWAALGGGFFCADQMDCDIVWRGSVCACLEFDLVQFAGAF